VNPIDPGLRVEQFDYDLPPELIAQVPLDDRDASRLLVVERSTSRVHHDAVRNLPALLRAGDLVVVNNTRVFAGRLRGRRATGGKVEFLLLRREEGRWLALAKPAKRLDVGETVTLTAEDPVHVGRSTARVLTSLGEGLVEIALSDHVEAHLESVGAMPLPPYVRERLANHERYQTVYATELGSAAAPTAGLHMTQCLLEDLRGTGINVGYATLHVGLDTFRPVTVERVADHVIHREWCEIGPELAEQIVETRRHGGRVIAIGTTTARTLETFGAKGGDGLAGGWAGWTDIFITPGYRWTVVDGMLTNFHLPRSTLLMMVSAFAGSELVRTAYERAIAERYRFYSFGDAMLIL